MTNILFTSEDYIKTNSNLSDNMFGKNLLPAMREAQDVYCQQIIGSTLYNKLIGLIDSGEIIENEFAIYKELLDDYVRPYLLYQTLVQLIPVINAKLVNFGTSQSNDEHLVNLSQGDVTVLTGHYQNMADFYCRRLQEFILQHNDVLDVDICTCEGIVANLKSSASCGIWLGGTRGRKFIKYPPLYSTN